MYKILSVVGTRSQVLKHSLLSREIKKQNLFTEKVVHTGQHYSFSLNGIIYKDLGIPKPDYILKPSFKHRDSSVLDELTKIFFKEKPNAIIIHGDTNSSLNAALVASKLNIPIIHVESGERVYRRKDFPEESIRVVVDMLSTLLFSSTERASKNLMREGVDEKRIVFSGDLTLDLFQSQKKAFSKKDFFKKLGLEKEKFHLATIHRLENIKDKKKLVSMLKVLDGSAVPVIFPMHPRVKKGLGWKPTNNLKITKPLSFQNMMNLLINCRRCVTDSGGLIRQAYFAGKPCIIPMKNSWWVDVVESGNAIEVGTDSKLLKKSIEDFDIHTKPDLSIFGKGNSASKIVKTIGKKFRSGFFDNDCWSENEHVFAHLNNATRKGSFTYRSYSDMIKKMKKKRYKFVPFQHAKKHFDSGKKFVLLRHDIDMDLEAARDIAKVEKRLGVVSTFFLQLRTNYYNLFSKENLEFIREIVSLGHEIGLHFDCGSYPENISSSKLSEACNKEAAILESWVGKKIHIVSYHRPNKLVLKGNSSISGNRDNTYMDLYTRKIKYCSDSNGLFRHGIPTETQEFKEGKPLQILIHPIWWNKKSLATADIMLDLVLKRKKKIEETIVKTCRIFRLEDLER